MIISHILPSCLSRETREENNTRRDEDGESLGRACVKKQFCKRTVMVFQEANGRPLKSPPPPAKSLREPHSHPPRDYPAYLKNRASAFWCLSADTMMLLPYGRSPGAWLTLGWRRSWQDARRNESRKENFWMIADFTDSIFRHTENQPADTHALIRDKDRPNRERESVRRTVACRKYTSQGMNST